MCQKKVCLEKCANQFVSTKFVEEFWFSDFFEQSDLEGKGNEES